MEKLVTVIMLTFNRERFVGKAIESVLSQKYTNFEFIIINNGSSDGSGEICLGYEKKDNRIKYYSIGKETIGYGRNYGLRQSNGNYITFVDDDDTCEPQMLTYLVELIERGEYDISLCGSYRDTEGVKTSKYVFEGEHVLRGAEPVKELLKREIYNSANPTKLFKRELFDHIKFEETGKYDDIAVMYKLFAEAKAVIAGGRPLYSFRRHPNNNSGFTTDKSLLKPEQLDEYLKVFKERTEYLSGKFPEEREFFFYQELSYMISMCRNIEKYKLDICRIQYNSMKTDIEKNLDMLRKCSLLSSEEKEYLNV